MVSSLDSYDPDVPMSKEQLAAWRREARRVRNRESAAASRQRIRNRISELEGEVSEWKSKFEQAMERLQRLQELKQQQQEEDGAELLNSLESPEADSAVANHSDQLPPASAAEEPDSESNPPPQDEPSKTAEDQQKTA